MLALKEAAGFEPEEELRLKGSLEQASLSPDRAQLLELAVSHRPDLAAQRANESIATAGLRQLQAEAKPDASFFPPVMNAPTAGFALSAFDAAGNLQPIRQTFNYGDYGGRPRDSLDPAYLQPEPGFDRRGKSRYQFGA